MSALQENLNRCQVDLQKALTDLDEMRKEYERTVTDKITSVQYLTDDLALKTKHIRELKDSYEKALEMLDQSQRRIGELEDVQNTYEEEIAKAKQNNSLELQESKEELVNLQSQVKRQEEGIKMYQNQVKCINTNFEDAKNKIVYLDNVLKTKEEELISTSQRIQQREEELKRMMKAKNEFDNQLSCLKNNLDLLQHEKEEMTKQNNSTFHDLQQKV